MDLGVRYDFEHLPAGFNQDTNNVSPRIGLAWNPLANWVFRGGYGIFFDRYVLANLTRAIETNGVQGFEQVVKHGGEFVRSGSGRSPAYSISGDCSFHFPS